MNIGQIAGRIGLPAKTIRYYEDIGLVTPMRAANGYRVYEEKDLHRLAFIQRARSFNFSIDECRLLLSLYEDKSRASADVKSIALSKIDEIERKICELRSLQESLKILAVTCYGDGHPDCPIIDELSRDEMH